MTPTIKNNLRPPLIKPGQVLSRPAPVKAPTPAPKAEPKKEPVEPDRHLFRRVLQDLRMLAIRMLNGSTLQARLVAFGRYSIACDVIYHNDEKCPQEQGLLRKAAIFTKAVFPVRPVQPAPDLNQ
jgi:hypothetical protein